MGRSQVLYNRAKGHGRYRKRGDATQEETKEPRKPAPIPETPVVRTEKTPVPAARNPAVADAALEQQMAIFDAHASSQRYAVAASRTMEEQPRLQSFLVPTTSEGNRALQKHMARALNTLPLAQLLFIPDHLAETLTPDILEEEPTLVPTLSDLNSDVGQSMQTILIKEGDTVTSMTAQRGKVEAPSSVDNSSTFASESMPDSTAGSEMFPPSAAKSDSMDDWLDSALQSRDEKEIQKDKKTTEEILKDLVHQEEEDMQDWLDSVIE